MLKAHDLNAGYGRIPVLRGVRLNMAPGEFTGILGRNGMGKTTLLRALMGELPLTGAASRSTAATSAGWRPMPARARGWAMCPRAARSSRR